MGTIILTAISYMLMIVFGYLFKRLNLVQQAHGKALAQLVMKLTLPAAIIASFATFSINYSLLILILFGFLGNVIQVVSGYLISKNKSRDDKILYIADAGYNIGNFTLPFTSSFSGALGTITTSLFDCGNAIMLLGFNYTIAENVANGQKGMMKLSKILKTLLSVPAFDAYLVMMAIVLPGGKVPAPIISIASEIAKANGPMAMFMIGIMLEIHFSKRYIKGCALIMGIRCAISIVFSIIFSQMSFLPPEVIKSAIIVSWSPIASASPAYVALLNGDEELASFVNTISIILSIILIPILAIVL